MSDYRYCQLGASDVATMEKLNAVFCKPFGEPDTYDPEIALHTRLGTREEVMHFDIAVPSA